MPQPRASAAAPRQRRTAPVLNVVDAAP